MDDHNTVRPDAHQVEHLGMIFQLANGGLDDRILVATKLCVLARVRG